MKEQGIIKKMHNTLYIASHFLGMLAKQDTVKIFILGRNKTGTPQKIVDCSSFVPYQHCFGGVSVPCQKKRGVRRFFFAQRCTMHLGGVGMGIKILP